MSVNVACKIELFEVRIIVLGAEGEENSLNCYKSQAHSTASMVTKHANIATAM